MLILHPDPHPSSRRPPPLQDPPPPLHPPNSVTYTQDPIDLHIVSRYVAKTCVNRLSSSNYVDYHTLVVKGSALDPKIEHDRSVTGA